MVLIWICVLYARDEMTCTLQTQMRNGINSCQTRPETVDYCEEDEVDAVAWHWSMSGK